MNGCGSSDGMKNHLYSKGLGYDFKLVYSLKADNKDNVVS